MCQYNIPLGKEKKKDMQYNGIIPYKKKGDIAFFFSLKKKCRRGEWQPICT